MHDTKKNLLTRTVKEAIGSKIISRNEGGHYSQKWKESHQVKSCYLKNSNYPFSLVMTDKQSGPHTKRKT